MEEQTRASSEIQAKFCFSSDAVLKDEDFISYEASKVEKLKPIYCSNCNKANIKDALKIISLLRI
jgi:hypothetical protein